MGTKQIFQPLKYRRLSEMIEKSVQDMVLTGNLTPGMRLPSEMELSRQFGVSVITVREALRGLEAYGLIDRKRGRTGGIFVSQNGDSPVKWLMPTLALSKRCGMGDFAETRMLIEPVAARLATSRVNREELRAIESNVEYCERRLAKIKPPMTRTDFFEIEERNVEFHRLIAQATHNPVLYLAVDYIMDLLFNMKKAVMKPGLKFSKDCVKGHSLILEGMRDTDGEAVYNAMVSHLEVVDGYLRELVAPSSGQQQIRQTGNGS